MVKIQPSFKYSQFHVNYFTIFSLITILSTDVTKLFHCKFFQFFQVTSSDVMFDTKSMLILVTTLGDDF